MRKFLVPEVVQTSSLDCGPASLKALLEGFGQPVSYGRLREACQTGLDGTSIEALELVANQLGLEAEQIMLPLDHLLLTSSKALPAIVVVILPQGLTHFVVVWRRVGRWLQVMDPAVGRRWISTQAFLQDVFRHKLVVGVQDWLQFASSDDFQKSFSERQQAVGVNLPRCQTTDWKKLASLDAALRLTHALVTAKGISKGAPAQKVLERFASEPALIPREYWSASDAGNDEEGNPQVTMCGAVLVRAKAKRSELSTDLSEELASAISEQRVNPGRELARLLFSSGTWIWPLLFTALLAASLGAFLQALLFRGLLDVNATLALVAQRMGAAGAVIVFCTLLLLLELPAFITGARLGRILENRLRIAFLEKLPKLSDRYFRSRPVSDMAERSHILHALRHLPDQLRQLIFALSQLLVTAAGVIWLEPRAWPFMLASLLAALIPLFSSRWFLAERALRLRTHSGGLMRFYLDAMLGLMPIRTHGAAANLRQQHGLLLHEWSSASFRLQRAIVLTEALQLTTMFALVAALLLMNPFTGTQMGRVLLMAYWALNMPELGQEIAGVARQYPYYRSIVMRLLEPLGAQEDEAVSTVASITTAPHLEFRNIDVVAAGTSILNSVSAEIQPGSQVAIVGPSGAGKSTLVGLLLGWLKPSAGDILINHEPLEVCQLRLSIAWVDPAVQLWNSSLQSNLLYGGNNGIELAEVVDTAALRHVLEGLPDGFETALGENGGLVSGGEGQRVRFGRALLRSDAKLVILDEPFRGLDRDTRRELLGRARRFWKGATILCVTHDLSETEDFNQALVIENGALVENGSPRELASNPESRYSQLLAAETRTRKELWQSSNWRRVRLHSGRVVEEMPKLVNRDARESEVA